MTALLDRPASVARQRVARAADAIIDLLLFPDLPSTPLVQWRDPGAYVTDATQVGDPKQNGVADCYFIAAVELFRRYFEGFCVVSP